MRGAYGLALSGGLGSEHPSLPEVPSTWPDWILAYESDERERWEPDFVLPLVMGGEVRFDWTRRRALFGGGGSRPTDEALMHPWLSGVGAVQSHHVGRTNFHAGGFVVDDAVWVVLGAKEAGKSTALAHMSMHGHVITADDLVVLDGTKCLSGPGCVDLRPPAASFLGVGLPADLGHGRVRTRMWTGAPPAEAPLGGFVYPTWGSSLSVTRMALSSGLRLLATSRSLYAPQLGGEDILRLLSFPVLEWRRVRDLQQLDVARKALLDAIASVS